MIKCKHLKLYNFLINLLPNEIILGCIWIISVYLRSASATHSTNPSNKLILLWKVNKLFGVSSKRQKLQIIKKRAKLIELMFNCKS